MTLLFWVLPPSSYKVLARSSISSLMDDDEPADPAAQARMAELDASIRENIGASISDEEVDPELANLLPTVLDELLLEEVVEYEPFKREVTMP
jgi:hypothetical protein